MTLNFICTQHPDIDNIIKESTFDDGCYNWHHYAGGIYLDGDVETANHYDCVELISASEPLETYRETDSYGTTVERTRIPDGIYDCTVHGYDKPCKAYIWHYNSCGFHYRGLIVDVNDKRAIDHAEKKYNEKSTCL